MKSAPRKQYTAEFKAQAIALVKLGKPVSEVAQDFGMGSALLYGWLRKDSSSASSDSAAPRPTAPTSEADELRRLRREVANLKLENDILKKAAVILGTKTPPNSAS